MSVTYYYSKLFQSPDPVNLYLHFETGKKFSRYDLADEHKEVLGRCHEYVIDNGKPLILSAVLPLFQSVEPKLTKDVMDGANKLGIFDQYMIPVYGPFKINGVISFGFADTIDPQNQESLERMIGLATVYHYQMVEHFGERRSDIDLSQRENEVLTWIAKGKSGADVATILGISASSVDTYTRRIFEKMGVNDRVSAAISGVVEGLIKPS